MFSVQHVFYSRVVNLLFIASLSELPDTVFISMVYSVPGVKLVKVVVVVPLFGEFAVTAAPPLVGLIVMPYFSKAPVGSVHETVADVVAMLLKVITELLVKGFGSEMCTVNMKYTCILYMLKIIR